METQTIAELKTASGIKLKVTKTAHEATIKALDPDTAVALAIKAHGLLLAHKAAGTAPAERDRAGLPALIRETAGGYVIKHGGGTAAPYDPAAQARMEDYLIKIDLVSNTKGIGWEITANNPGSVEAGLALIGYTERLLQEAFAPASDVVL